LQRQTNIEVDSQVLICEWEPERSLERRKAVAFYGLPKEGNFIFLYDKAWFRSVRPLFQSAPLPRGGEENSNHFSSTH
jgi:hypothetical protein